MTEPTEQISLHADIDAEIQFVYSALTDEVQIRRWASMWGGCDFIEVAIDANPGGEYSVMTDAGGNQQWTLRGVFLDVAPDRLSATCDIHGLRGKLPVVTIDLHKHDQKTHVALDISGISSTKAHRRLRIGWNRILEMMVHGIGQLHQLDSTDA